MSTNSTRPQLIAEAGHYVQLQFKMTAVSGKPIFNNWTSAVAGVPPSSIPGIPGPCEVTDLLIRLIDRMRQTINAQQVNPPSPIIDFVIVRFEWDVQLGEVYAAVQFNPGSHAAIGSLSYKVV